MTSITIDGNSVQKLYDSVIDKDYDTFSQIIENHPNIFYSQYIYRVKYYSYVEAIDEFMYRHVGLIPYQFVEKMIGVGAIKKDDYDVLSSAFRPYGYECIGVRYGKFDLTDEEFQENFYRTIEMLIDYFGVETLNSVKFDYYRSKESDLPQCNIMERCIETMYVNYDTSCPFYQDLIIMMFQKGISLPQVYMHDSVSSEYTSESSLRFIFNAGFLRVIEYLICHHPESIKSIPMERKEEGYADFKKNVEYWKRTIEIEYDHSRGGVQQAFKETEDQGKDTLFNKYHPETGVTLVKLAALVVWNDI